MTTAIVIDALMSGRATPEQLTWAQRRVAVLLENKQVFGELSPEEQSELEALHQALDGAADLSN